MPSYEGMMDCKLMVYGISPPPATHTGGGVDFTKFSVVGSSMQWKYRLKQIC